MSPLGGDCNTGNSAAQLVALPVRVLLDPHFSHSLRRPWALCVPELGSSKALGRLSAPQELRAAPHTQSHVPVRSLSRLEASVQLSKAGVSPLQVAPGCQGSPALPKNLYSDFKNPYRIL